MPTKSKTPPSKRAGRTTQTKGYLCLSGFSYPASLAIRDRIRAGDHMPYEERGEWTRHAEGDTITNPPSDLIKGWLERGIVELVDAKKGATDDSPK